MVMEIDIVKKIMQSSKISSFIIDNLISSLKDIGFSNIFINDLLGNLAELDINLFQKKYSGELQRVYTGNFFQKIVPDYFEKYVFPELEEEVILDIGCGTGILAKRLEEKNKIRKVIGIDINSYPEWEKFTSKKVEFKIVKEVEFEEFLDSINFDAIVLTWTLHHMEYEEQIKYLKILYYSVKKGTKIIILEDSFSEKLKPLVGSDKYNKFSLLSIKDKNAVMSIYDWVANRILAQRDKVPIPFAYRTLEEWIRLCKKIGFQIKTQTFIGIPNKRDINTPQSLFVIET